MSIPYKLKDQDGFYSYSSPPFVTATWENQIAETRHLEGAPCLCQRCFHTALDMWWDGGWRGAHLQVACEWPGCLEFSDPYRAKAPYYCVAHSLEKCASCKHLLTAHTDKCGHCVCRECRPGFTRRVVVPISREDQLKAAIDMARAVVTRLTRLSKATETK